MEFVWFSISWVVIGFVAGLIKIIDKDFKEIHERAINASGLGNPPNPILFSLAMSTVFGYYAMYVEMKYLFNKKL